MSAEKAMKITKTLVLVLGFALLQISCTGNARGESGVNDTPLATTTEAITATIHSSPPPEITPVPSVTPTPSPTPEKSSLRITPIVSPGPTVSGTYYPDRYCYGVPDPVLTTLDLNDPDVFLAGTFYLCDPFYTAIDLDKVIIGDFFILEPEKNLVGADIHLRWGTASPEAWIISLDTAQLRSIDDDLAPTMEECRNHLEDYPFGGLIILAGENPEILDEYGCLLTTEGRMGYLRIEEINPLGSLSVKLSFVIWDNNLP